MSSKIWIIPGFGYCAVLCCAIALPSHCLAQAGGPLSGGAPQSAQGGGEETNPPVIDSIHITGAKKVSTEDILAGITMKVGVKISRSMVKTSCNEIAAIYQKNGSDAAVTPNITHPSDGHVVVELIVDENGKGGFLWPAPGSAAPGGTGGGAPAGAPPNN